MVAIVRWRCSVAANPSVSKVEGDTAYSPEELDALIGRKVSAKSRAILLAALTRTNGHAFNRLLASMPNVGEDSDFARGNG